LTSLAEGERRKRYICAYRDEIGATSFSQMKNECKIAPQTRIVEVWNLTSSKKKGGKKDEKTDKTLNQQRRKHDNSEPSFNLGGGTLRKPENTRLRVKKAWRP